MYEAVILAAGKGTRLGKITKRRPKFLIDLYGYPLIYYAITSLEAIGVSKINLVIQDKWLKKAKKILSKFDLYVELNFIGNDDVDRDNGYSFLLAKEHITSQKFLLTMCDHLFSRIVLEEFVSNARNYESALMVIAGDANPRFVSVEEATKILVDEEGNALAIGKKIKSFNAVDIGLFVVDKRFYDAIDDVVNKKYVLKLSDIITEAIKRDCEIKVVRISKSLWTEIDTPEDYFDLYYGKRKEVFEHVRSNILLRDSLHLEKTQMIEF